MKVGLSGWGGFLATKLRDRIEIEWVEDTENIDCYLHLGSPTFTHPELSMHDAQVVHQYVKDSMRLINRLDVPVVFGSTTGVDDIQLDHKGSTAYNLGKLFLENYIINNCQQYMILRIGTVISSNSTDISLMKPDRIQPRLGRGDVSNIEFEDYYLDIDVFVNTTIEKLLNFKTGIVTYNLTKLTLPKLMALGKSNDFRQ
jgi:hypothetical protein